jgi:hypothetical protein
MNARNRSTKSGFIGLSSKQLPLFDGEPPRQQHTVARRHLPPELGVVLVGLRVRGEPAGRDAGANTIGHMRIIAGDGR